MYIVIIHTSIITLCMNILHYYLHGKLGKRRSCEKFPALCFKNYEVTKGAVRVVLQVVVLPSCMLV